MFVISVDYIVYNPHGALFNLIDLLHFLTLLPRALPGTASICAADMVQVFHVIRQCGRENCNKGYADMIMTKQICCCITHCIFAHRAFIP